MHKPRLALLAASAVSIATAGVLLLWPDPPPVIFAAGALPAPILKAVPTAVTEKRITEVTVKPGETLSSLARTYLGGDWPALFARNSPPLESPDIVPAGTVLQLPVNLKYWDQRYATWEAAQKPAGPPPQQDPAPVSPDPAPVSVLAAAQVGALWITEGGPASAESAAECVVNNESGGRTDATHVDSNGSADTGLYQVNSGNAPSSEMLNPAANTQEAVHLFDDEGGWLPDWVADTAACGL